MALSWLTVAQRSCSPLVLESTVYLQACVAFARTLRHFSMLLPSTSTARTQHCVVMLASCPNGCSTVCRYMCMT
jgi:hypothetical protein